MSLTRPVSSSSSVSVPLLLLLLLLEGEGKSSRCCFGLGGVDEGLLSLMLAVPGEVADFFFFEREGEGGGGEGER